MLKSLILHSSLITVLFAAVICSDFSLLFVSYKFVVALPVTINYLFIFICSQMVTKKGWSVSRSSRPSTCTSYSSYSISTSSGNSNTLLSFFMKIAFHKKVAWSAGKNFFFFFVVIASGCFFSLKISGYAFASLFTGCLLNQISIFRKNATVQNISVDFFFFPKVVLLLVWAERWFLLWQKKNKK